ncbi:ArsR/SmtB family transcription factor [Pelagerythrobacter marensis]|nr:metalloregulator ArsR/SmtB family transcription factor [Pelagerythrobacter marensis]
MDMDRAQHALLTDLANLARTLGSPQRLLLLQHAAQGARPVERLAELSGLSVANASQHLQHLKRSSLVVAERKGKQVLYSLAGGPITDVLGALTRLAQHQRSEIRSVISASLTQPDDLEGISLDELLERLRDSSVILLDVRPPEEFAMGHLPGAINVPVEGLEDHLPLLARDREIIAYCRGPHCVLSTSAVDIMRKEGIRARQLNAGFPEWKAAGHTVVTGA